MESAALALCVTISMSVFLRVLFGPMAHSSNRSSCAAFGACGRQSGTCARSAERRDQPRATSRAGALTNRPPYTVGSVFTANGSFTLYTIAQPALPRSTARAS